MTFLLNMRRRVPRGEEPGSEHLRLPGSSRGLPAPGAGPGRPSAASAPGVERRYAWLVGSVLLLVAALTAAEEGRMEPLPGALEGVGIEERVGERIPQDLSFVNSEGRTVRLGEVFTGERPVLLMLVYYRCPMLCGLLFNGVVEGLRELAWTPGRQFDIVTVSIDPLETPTLARAKKQNYLKMYERSEAAAGWHFLTGREQDIRALARSVGFGYRWVDERQEYAHAAAVMVMTPDGRVSRYLYGLLYDGRTLRLALTEAGEGKVGSTADRFLLYCFHYDANAGRFVVAAANLMRLGALGTAGVLGVWLGGWWLREWRRRRAPREGNG